MTVGGSSLVNFKDPFADADPFVDPGPPRGRERAPPSPNIGFLCQKEFYTMSPSSSLKWEVIRELEGGKERQTGYRV